MSSKSIYDKNPQLPPRQEYFYIIQHKVSGKFYAGSAFAEYSRYVHPDQFWNSDHKFPYYTSSNKINELRLSEGDDAFSVLRLRKCINAKEYETKFLRKIKAKTNSMWFNCHENDGNFIRTGPHSDETKLKQSISKLGVKHSEIHKQRNGDSRRGKPQTEIANIKRSLALSNTPKRILHCPHCNKSGGEPQMKRWHFDNCKALLVKML